MPGAASDSEGRDEVPEEPDVEALLQQLEELEATVDDPEEREEVREAMHLARRLPEQTILGERIRKYTTRDMAEAFVGAILFAVPLLVEDGVFDIAAHFVEVTVAGVPLYFLGNVAFVVVMTHGLIYWTDIQLVQRDRLFGLIPRRLLGVLTISFLTAGAMMVLWGRLDDLADPWLALSRIVVVWTVAAFGAALGDILPGESRGENVGDVVGEELEDLFD